MLKVRGFDQEGRSSLFMIKIMDIYRKLRWLLGVGQLFVCLSPFFCPYQRRPPLRVRDVSARLLFYLRLDSCNLQCKTNPDHSGLLEIY